MCDSWVAMADCTSFKNVVMAKNSDRPIFDSQQLILYPRMQWPVGSVLKLEYLEIPQVEFTWATLGSSPYWCWGYEEGINECDVAIGNQAVFTRTLREAVEACRKGKEPKLGLLGMDIVRLALERSDCALGAVELIGGLLEEYGQFGSSVPGKSHIEGSYDNSFLISDPREAWILESVGTRWTAKRIVKGYASLSNELSIRTRWDLGSIDIKQHAIEKGWWPDDDREKFDFARAYLDEKVPRQVSHIRAMRSKQLLAEKCTDRITLRWMMRIARDHYEGSFLKGPYFDAADPDFHSICMHVSPAEFTWGNTASSCIAILPECTLDFPVFWWTPGPPCSGCYIPFFVHGSKLPDIISTAGTSGKKLVSPLSAEVDEFSSGSYWWLFRRLTDKVRGDSIKSLPGCYTLRQGIVRRKFDAVEAGIEAELPAILKKAREQMDINNGAAAILDEFMESCVNKVVIMLVELLKEFE